LGANKERYGRTSHGIHGETTGNPVVCMGLVVGFGETRNALKILIGNFEGRSLVRPRHRLDGLCKGKIFFLFKEIPSHEDVWGSEGVTTCVLNVRARWG